uniref:Uncharacterized protein n=1 Tax=Globodera rostochiensis TaxID=31243 RepID=A0A914HAV8_GLORO
MFSPLSRRPVDGAFPENGNHPVLPDLTLSEPDQLIVQYNGKAFLDGGSVIAEKPASPVSQFAWPKRICRCLTTRPKKGRQPGRRPLRRRTATLCRAVYSRREWRGGTGNGADERIARNQTRVVFLYNGINQLKGERSAKMLEEYQKQQQHNIDALTEERKGNVEIGGNFNSGGSMAAIRSFSNQSRVKMNERLNMNGLIQQNRWNSMACHKDLVLFKPGRLIVQHNGENWGWWGSVRAEKALVRKTPYFELCFVHLPSGHFETEITIFTQHGNCLLQVDDVQLLFFLSFSTSCEHLTVSRVPPDASTKADQWKLKFFCQFVDGLLVLFVLVLLHLSLQSHVSIKQFLMCQSARSAF